MQHIVTQMEKVAIAKKNAKKKNKLKVAIFSGHDLTVGSVLNALGLYDNINPVYTATVFFELVYGKNWLKLFNNVKCKAVKWYTVTSILLAQKRAL